MNRQREAGFSQVKGFVHIFGLFGFHCLLTCGLATLAKYGFQFITHGRLPSWLFLVVFISCFVIASVATFGLLSWFDKKYSKEFSVKCFDLVCITGCLFWVVAFIFTLVLLIRDALRHL